MGDPKGGGSVTRISISGVVGGEVLPSDVRDALDVAGGAPVRIEIASPGGFVTDGLEIYNLIRAYPGPKTTHLMGLAASMASYIALAGDRVTAEANTVFMIHNAWGGAVGDHNDLRHSADVIEKLSMILAMAYAQKSGKSLEEIRRLMDAETWYTAQEALEAGFVDEVVGQATVTKAQAVAQAREACTARAAAVAARETRDAPERLAAFLNAAPAFDEAAAVSRVRARHDEIRAKLAARERVQADALAQARGEAETMATMRVRLAASRAVHAGRDPVQAIDEEWRVMRIEMLQEDTARLAAKGVN